jgi:hypothetical protein
LTKSTQPAFQTDVGEDMVVSETRCGVSVVKGVWLDGDSVASGERGVSLVAVTAFPIDGMTVRVDIAVGLVVKIGIGVGVGIEFDAGAQDANISKKIEQINGTQLKN